MSNKRLKNDQNKIILTTHYAFNKTFEQIEPFDFAFNGVYYTRTANLEDMMYDYERAYQLFKEAHPKNVVTIFDKALCMGLILRKYQTFGSSQKKAPRRVALLNERFIAEVMVAFLHYSEYSIRAKNTGELLSPTPFDLQVLSNGHEEQFEELMRDLTVLLSAPDFQATEINSKLREIYNLAILYGNGFNEEDFASIIKRIRVKERNSTPNFNYEESPMLQQHQQEIKGKYRRR